MVEQPVVKRAANAGALDLTACTEMSPEVRQ